LDNYRELNAPEDKDQLIKSTKRLEYIKRYNTDFSLENSILQSPFLTLYFHLKIRWYWRTIRCANRRV